MSADAEPGGAATAFLRRLRHGLDVSTGLPEALAGAAAGLPREVQEAASRWSSSACAVE